MKFIISFIKEIKEDYLETICNLPETDIIYESKLLPIIGVITNHPDEISKLDYVKNVRPSRKGIFQEGEFLTTIIFEPPLNKRVLVNNGLCGWGDTRIFVLDSGVNEVSIVEHKVFVGNGTQDLANHGTVVAKIIKNFAKGANLYSGKIGVYEPDELAMMQGIEWALEKGANIINISSGFESDNECSDCELCELVNLVSQKGVAIVVAAGNKDNVLGSIACPAVATNAITVGAINGNKEIASYSSIGKPGSNKPNLVAPGNLHIDGQYRTGTSFAAPVISGILGAINNKVSNVFQACEFIYATADDLNLPLHIQGAGCINLERLVGVILSESEKNSTKGAGQE